MITTGVTGGRWRASITPFGAIVPFGNDRFANDRFGNDDDNRLGLPIDWHIAADDRWHSPEHEPTVRQRRIDGTAVVETRVRIPDGDAVQRVFSAADHGGLTVIEVENESPLPIAVAFTSGRLLSLRPSAAPIEGISLPQGSVAFPVGHRSTLTVALPHSTNAHLQTLPSGLPTADAVARGWLATAERAGRVVSPDVEFNERIISARCELLLCGPPLPEADAVGFILVVDQLVRMGERAEPFIPELANALELAAKSADQDWALAAGLAAADRVLAAAHETRARRDLVTMGQRLDVSNQLARVAPSDPIRSLAWTEQGIAAPRSGRAELLSAGLPASWLGNNFEVFAMPTGATGTVSFAVRWHGDRPAILWEQSPGDDGPVELTAPALAPHWSSSEVSGEALWDKYNR